MVLIRRGCREYKGTTIAASAISARWKAAQRMELGARRAQRSPADAGVSNERADDLNLVQPIPAVTLTSDLRGLAKNDAAIRTVQFEQECFQEN